MLVGSKHSRLSTICTPACCGHILPDFHKKCAARSRVCRITCIWSARGSPDSCVSNDRPNLFSRQFVVDLVAFVSCHKQLEFIKSPEAFNYLATHSQVTRTAQSIGCTNLAHLYSPELRFFCGLGMNITRQLPDQMAHFWWKTGKTTLGQKMTRSHGFVCEAGQQRDHFWRITTSLTSNVYANRAGALFEKTCLWRIRPRLRNWSTFPKRGNGQHAQPWIYDLRVLLGV